MKWSLLLVFPALVVSASDYAVNPKVAAAHRPPPNLPPPAHHPPPPPAPVKPLGQGTGNDKYMPIDPRFYTPDEVSKAADKEDCHAVEKIVYQDKCIPYIEKTCYTQQVEKCKPAFEKNCTAVIDSFQKRECFDVTELLCQLTENIEYVMVDEQYTVQRCTRVSDRVCDTVYDMAVTTKDDFKCVDVQHHYCWSEEKILKDRTCVFTVDFDCKKDKPEDGEGVVKCEKTPTKKCYDSPRKVSQEICKPRTSKWCEKLTNEIPFPAEKQNCHSEPMKRCELETRIRPKRAKRYVYTQECSPVKRKVCENREVKKLRPRCDKIQKNICSYRPEERCKEDKKEYCFKVESKVWDKVCTPETKRIVDETFSYV